MRQQFNADYIKVNLSPVDSIRNTLDQMGLDEIAASQPTLLNVILMRYGRYMYF